MPIALFGGKKDRLASPGDYLWLRDQLGETVVKFEELDLGHLGLLMPEDTSYFNQIGELLHHYSPV